MRGALRLSEKLGRQEWIALDNYRLAKSLLRQGLAAEVLRHAQKAVEIYTRLGSPNLTATQTILAECEAAV